MSEIVKGFAIGDNIIHLQHDNDNYRAEYT